MSGYGGPTVDPWDAIKQRQQREHEAAQEANRPGRTQTFQSVRKLWNAILDIQVTIGELLARSSSTATGGDLTVRSTPSGGQAGDVHWASGIRTFSLPGAVGGQRRGTLFVSGNMNGSADGNSMPRAYIQLRRGTAVIASQVFDLPPNTSFLPPDWGAQFNISASVLSDAAVSVRLWVASFTGTGWVEVQLTNLTASMTYNDLV